MKNMVQILIQPYWNEWLQDFALRASRNAFRDFVYDLDSIRWIRGDGACDRSKLLGYHEVRHWLLDKYIEQRGAYKIRMDYAQFERYTLGFIAIGNEYRIDRYRPWGAANCPFREGWSYRRNVDHKPKESRDDTWHTEIGHQRDKAKAGRWTRSGAKGFYKRQSPRSHRAWIREQLQKENWDSFSRGSCDKEWRVFADPWDWD